MRKAMYYLQTFPKRRKKSKKSRFDIPALIFQFTLFSFTAYMGVFVTQKEIERSNYSRSFMPKVMDVADVKMRRNTLKTTDMDTLIREINYKIVDSVDISFFRYHRTNIVRVGEGFCRMYGKKMPWRPKEFCVSEIGQCRKVCEIAKNCVGFSFAENPIDNLNSCKENKLGRCVMFIDEHPVGHQVYSSLVYDDASKAYDCYRQGEHKGFYYFPLAVADKRDPSIVNNWSLVLSTQGGNDRVTKTGEGTHTFAGLFDENHKYHFEFVVHYDEFMKSIQENDAVLLITLLERGDRGTYRGRVITGHANLVQMLTHAKLGRAMQNGKFAFHSSDSKTLNRVQTNEKYKPKKDNDEI